MNKESILTKLKKIINEIVENQISITEETALIGQGIMDSMEFMNYITQVESDFDIKIDENAVNQRQLGVVKNMIEYILSQFHEKQ